MDNIQLHAKSNVVDPEIEAAGPIIENKDHEHICERTNKLYKCLDTPVVISTTPESSIDCAGSLDVDDDKKFNSLLLSFKNGDARQLLAKQIDIWSHQESNQAGSDDEEDFYVETMRKQIKLQSFKTL